MNKIQEPEAKITRIENMFLLLPTNNTGRKTQYIKHKTQEKNDRVEGSIAAMVSARIAFTFSYGNL